MAAPSRTSEIDGTIGTRGTSATRAHDASGARRLGLGRRGSAPERADHQSGTANDTAIVNVCNACRSAAHVAPAARRDTAIRAGERPAARLARHGPASVRRRAPRAAGARPASRRDGAARAGPVRRAGRVSGKTTTLVARVAWLIADGVAARRDRGDHVQQARRRRAGRAARRGRGAARRRARRPSGSGRSTPSGCEILRDAGVAGRAAGRPGGGPARGRAVGRRAAGSSSSTAPISRLKVELGVTAGDGRGRPRRRARSPGRSSPTRRRVAARGGLDFDDLVLRAIDAARGATPALLARWRERCAAPARRRGPGRRPRAAPARPAAGRAGEPDLPRRRRRPVDLRLAAGRRPADPRPRRRPARACAGSTSRSTTAAPPRSWSGPSGSSSTTASGSRSAIRAGPAADGRARPRAGRRPTSRSGSSARSRTWPDDGSTRAVLARTNRELLPAVVVALGPRPAVPGAADRAARSTTRRLDGLLDRRRGEPSRRRASPCSSRSARVRAAVADDRRAGPSVSSTALLAWAPRLRRPRARSSRPSTAARPRLAELRRDDAPLTLATAHATKGLEFDHVVVVGMEAGRFPSARAVAEAEDPARAYEEERRLGVRRLDPGAPHLTLLYDPAVPSPFLLEAFSAEELGLSPRPCSPVELAEEPVDRVEERLGQLGRQHVPDRVLRPVGRPARASPSRAAPPGRRRAADRAAARGRRPSASAPELARRGEQPVGVPRGLEPGLVDRRVARAGRAHGRVRRPGASVIRRRGPVMPASPVAVAGGASSSSGRRLRSEPLTRIRNE